MRRSSYAPPSSAALPLLLVLASASGQTERHARGYRPPPPTAPVVVTVEKATNEKPLPNVSVIFRSTKDDAVNGNLEMKTDPDGHASMDLLEVGSHVIVQVIADGYATSATEFDLTKAGQQVLVKMQKPRAQVSTYGDARDQAAPVQPGVQEHHAPGNVAPGTTPTAVPPPPASPTGPLQTTPPANTPATVPGAAPGAASGPSTPPAGSPQ